MWLLWLSTSSSTNRNSHSLKPLVGRHLYLWLQVTTISSMGGDTEQTKSHGKPLLLGNVPNRAGQSKHFPCEGSQGSLSNLEGFKV